MDKIKNMSTNMIEGLKGSSYRHLWAAFFVVYYFCISNLEAIHLMDYKQSHVDAARYLMYGGAIVLLGVTTARSISDVFVLFLRRETYEEMQSKIKETEQQTNYIIK